jgi:hypothetical protein
MTSSRPGSVTPPPEPAGDLGRGPGRPRLLRWRGLRRACSRSRQRTRVEATVGRDPQHRNALRAARPRRAHRVLRRAHARGRRLRPGRRARRATFLAVRCPLQRAPRARVRSECRPGRRRRAGPVPELSGPGRVSRLRARPARARRLSGWKTTADRDRARAEGVDVESVLTRLDRPKPAAVASAWETPPCAGCGGLLSRKDLAEGDGLCWACRPALVAP